MSLKFRPRLKIYKNSSGRNTFNPETCEAHSYGHWKYVTKVNNTIIFNDYTYSMTTNKHQSEMRSLLCELELDKNVIYVDQRESLTSGIFLNSLYEDLILAEIRVKRKGMRKQFYKEKTEIIKTIKEKIEQ
jgi:hypothetical protein